jgi:hypothetical protein
MTLYIYGMEILVMDKSSNISFQRGMSTTGVVHDIKFACQKQMSAGGSDNNTT